MLCILLALVLKKWTRNNL
uniref:Uncharacterized protein n=1 Tax=Anguilla anguilla TaxID=7936 RepID=A0A0E9PAT0_ANGAN